MKMDAMPAAGRMLLDAATATAGIATIKAADATSRRLEYSAAERGRAAWLRTTADVIAAALRRMTELAYEDVGGVLVNIAPTGEVRTSVPWSQRNHARWRLARSQQLLLRNFMVAWHERPLKPQVFFLYRRRWYLNLRDYPTLASALAAIDGVIDDQVVAQLDAELAAARIQHNAAQRQQRANGITPKPRPRRRRPSAEA